MEKIYEQIKNINMLNIADINQKILLNFLKIKESIPYEKFFENFFKRLIRKRAIRHNLFLRKKKFVEGNLVENIIKKIKEEK